MGKVYLGFGAIALYSGILMLAGQVEKAKPVAYEPLAMVASNEQYTTPLELKAKLKEGATWLHFYRQECPCSRAATAHVVALKQRFPDLNWLGINVGEHPGPLHDPFLGVTLEGESHFDESGQIAAAYGVSSTPTAVLVDRTGKVTWKGSYREVGDHPGYTAEDAFADFAAGKPLQSGQMGDGCLIP